MKTSNPIPPSHQVENLKIPTFNQLIEAYPEVCKVRRDETGGKPCYRTEYNNILALKHIIKVLNFTGDEPYTSLTMEKLSEVFVELKNRGFQPISAKAYIEHACALCAKWAIIYYRRLGYSIKPIDRPSLFVPPFRYREKPKDQKQQTIAWYNTLFDSDQDMWFFVTMMLQFGMRNNDVERLTWDNFQEESDNVYLTYTPNKTKLTSGRIVHWPVNPELWKQLLRYKATHSKRPFVWDDWSKQTLPEGYKFKSSRNTYTRTQDALRKKMRELGYTGSKCAYELRKLCACAIYKNFGQEAASSLLGDNIDTILKHYADPSSIGKVCDVTSIL